MSGVVSFAFFSCDAFFLVLGMTRAAEIVRFLFSCDLNVSGLVCFYVFRVMSFFVRLVRAGPATPCVFAFSV